VYFIVPLQVAKLKLLLREILHWFEDHCHEYYLIDQQIRSSERLQQVDDFDL